eukprot:SM002847S10644  [mRNA]  locus=s2847:1149:1397:- [translate_table: standard]
MHAAGGGCVGNLTQEYGDRLKVVKVETDPNPKLVEKYKVYGLPTLILFDKGAPVPGARSEGAVTKAKLRQLLDDKLPALAQA